MDPLSSADELKTAYWTRADNLHLLRGPLYLCYQRGLMDWLRDVEPDVLIVEAKPRYLATSSAVKWMHAQTKPVIGWESGRRLLEAGLPALRAVASELPTPVRCADLPIRRAARSSMLNLGYPADRIFVAPNATRARSDFSAAGPPGWISTDARSCCTSEAAGAQAARRPDPRLCRAAGVAPA